MHDTTITMTAEALAILLESTRRSTAEEYMLPLSLVSDRFPPIIIPRPEAPAQEAPHPVLTPPDTTPESVKFDLATTRRHYFRLKKLLHRLQPSGAKRPEATAQEAPTPTPETTP